MLEKLLDIPREVNFSIETEAWRFQILRPNEKNRRAQLISRILGGAPIESVTQEDYSRAFKLATLAVAYLEGPPVFVEKYHKDFGEIADDNYIDMLFTKYMEHDGKFEEAKKNFDPLKEAKNPKYILDAFLICNFKLLPDTLRDEPYNLWFHEEKKFVFYLDAIWSKRSKDVQIIEVIISEIFDVLDAPDSEYMPAGLAKNMEMTLKNSANEPEEYREMLKRQMLEMPHQKKRVRVLELFDILKQYVDGERLVEITKQLNEAMHKKMGTSSFNVASANMERPATNE